MLQKILNLRVFYEDFIEFSRKTERIDKEEIEKKFGSYFITKACKECNGF